MDLSPGSITDRGDLRGDSLGFLGQSQPSEYRAIYGVEQTEATKALVLELVEGETLAERIARGRVSIKGFYRTNCLLVLCCVVQPGARTDRHVN